MVASKFFLALSFVVLQSLNQKITDKTLTLNSCGKQPIGLFDCICRKENKLSRGFVLCHGGLSTTCDICIPNQVLGCSASQPAR